MVKVHFSSPYGVLFVCLGNICRSPLGEGVFQTAIAQRGLTGHFHVDSCGTGSWHIGSPPHDESQRVALDNGIDISQQRARQLSKNDAINFPMLIAMDRSNRNDILSICGKETRVHCLREFDPEPHSLDVPDPYYGGPADFQEVFEIIDRSVARLIDSLCKDLGLPLRS